MIKDSNLKMKLSVLHESNTQKQIDDSYKLCVKTYLFRSEVQHPPLEISTVQLPQDLIIYPLNTP